MIYFKIVEEAFTAVMFPVVTVQILAIFAYWSVSLDTLASDNATSSSNNDNWAEETPYRETINGIRAIAPAVIFFFLLGRFVLKVIITRQT